MRGAKTHPIVVVAAVTVLVISAMGAAALTGLLPAASSKLEDPASMAARMASAPAVQHARAATPQAAACTHCGVIESIRRVEVDGEANGVGALASRPMGRGSAGSAMTIAGAAGGAYASNAIETKVKKSIAYRVTLRMDDGTYRTLSQPEAPRFAVGERVRIAKGLVLERV